MKKLIIFICILHAYEARGASSSTEGTAARQFTINDTKDSMIAHIRNEQQRARNDKTHFSHTYVYKYLDGKFKNRGTVASCSCKETLKAIEKDNFVYERGLALMRSNNPAYPYIIIGAIIAGTQKKEVGDIFRGRFVQNLHRQRMQQRPSGRP